MDASSSNLLIFDRICTGGVVEKYDNVYQSTSWEKIGAFELPFDDLDYKFGALPYYNYDIDADVFSWFGRAFTCCNSQNKNEIVSEAIGVLRVYQRLLQPPVLEAILFKVLVCECYRLNIQDSQIMLQFFDLLGSSKEYFMRFHEPVVRRLLENRSKSEISCLLSFLTFYLEHARRLRLEYNGIRFVDMQFYTPEGDFRIERRRLEVDGIEFIQVLTHGRDEHFPVFLAARLQSWRAVLRYLQFGAKFEEVRKKKRDRVVNPESEPSHDGVVNPENEPSHDGVVNPESEPSHDGVVNPESEPWSEPHDTMLYLMDFLKQVLVWPAMLVENKAIRCINPDPGAGDLFHTIKIILRAVRCFPSDCVTFLDSEDKIDSYSFVRHEAVQRMFPTFKQRCRDANELQHACRCKIRACLNRNFLLPWGINELPIPRKLKKYLNLLSG